MRPRALLLYAAATLLLFFATLALSKKPRPQPCSGGRFLVQTGELVTGASTTAQKDIVILQGQQVGIGSGCPLNAAKLKATKNGTKVTGHWSSCGTLRNARLRALIAPDCQSMTGRFKAKKTPAKAFQASRSFCGDRIIDQGGGEACDSGVGCPNDESCTEMCACVAGLGATTTLPSSTTSLTTISRTTTTTVCPAGERLCSGSCVDTSNDPNNCGGCGFMCRTGAGFVCTAGICTCPEGDTLCGTRCDLRPCYCTNLQTDAGNCGSCGRVCNGAPGEICQGGVCTCPGGQTICNGLCVDTQTDNNNCGSCGNVCSTQPVCIGGVCTIL